MRGDSIIGSGNGRKSASALGHSLVQAVMVSDGHLADSTTGSSQESCVACGKLLNSWKQQ